MELTLSFLESKLKEAEKSVNLYITMLDEITKARDSVKATEGKNKFLNLIITKEPEKCE
jgi:hypothetical protein